MALTALSHLIVFDALGASLCVAVDVLSNFEVWRRSSIRHPFGLERAEVLAGFAMSVFLLFMGFDIVSHAAEHLLEGLWGEEGGNVHEDHVARVSAGSVDSAALVALVATTVSAVLLKNHERISRGLFVLSKLRMAELTVCSNAVRLPRPPPVNPLQPLTPPHPRLLHPTAPNPAP